MVELLVGDDAHVRYLSVQEHGPRTWQVALQRAHLGRDATLRSSAVALGGDYARLRSESRLDGAGSESDLLAVYFGDGDQMLDFRTLQDHDAPHTRSNLLFKGAVEDHARSVYSGLVRLRPHAQQSEAYQTNRNLVLTEGAGAESIPNLEIEANDVRCSHASTVGPIDEDQRYYLATRGIPPEEADRLIVLGFFDDVFSAPARARRSSRRCAARSIGKIEHPGDMTRSRVCKRRRRPGRVRRGAFDVDGHRLVRRAHRRRLVRDRTTSARTRTTPSPRATCGPTSARSSARSTARRSRSTTGEPQTLPATQPVPVYDVRVDGDDVVRGAAVSPSSQAPR